MSDLEYGEVVDIRVVGATFSYGSAAKATHDRYASFTVPVGDATMRVEIPLLHPAVTITRRVPVDGEPQPGDIWGDQLGGRYFALTAAQRVGGRRVKLANRDDGELLEWELLHADDELGPLSLVYRPEVR